MAKMMKQAKRRSELCIGRIDDEPIRARVWLQERLTERERGAVRAERCREETECDGVRERESNKQKVKGD